MKSTSGIASATLELDLFPHPLPAGDAAGSGRSGGWRFSFTAPPPMTTCYTLITTGSESGYEPGRKVSETRHTVLGRHTETGQPTTSGLDSGRPTLRHQETPGPSTGTGNAQALPQRKTTLVVIIRRTSNRKENGNARRCESRSRNRSGVVSRGTAQRNNTTSRESRYRCRRPARGDTAAPRCQETRGIMLPLASSSLTPDYGDELWALPALDSVSVSPPLIRDAYNDYDAGHVPHQGEGQ